jgi:hypothetical protein
MFNAVVDSNDGNPVLPAGSREALCEWLSHLISASGWY